MPLHLLGKKSWNVYNADNIARVQRDEAAARARDEAEEQRMQELDAQRRLAILRGDTPPPLPAEDGEQQKGKQSDPERRSSVRRGDRHLLPDGRRKRKRAGEDDTDFEMRLARERAETGGRVARELADGGGGGSAKKHSSSSKEVALIDSAGHISLFEPPPVPDRAGPRGKEKNQEAEREAARQDRELKDQYQMRLVNAAGKDGQGLTDGGPWYAAPDGDSSAALVAPSKNVFGREDPGRKVREAARLDANDPLAMMKMGAAKVRQLEKERRAENEEREEELRALRKEERRRERRSRQREGDERRDHRHQDDRRDSGRSDREKDSRSERSRHSDHRNRDRGDSRERDHERRHRDDDKHRDRHHHHDQPRKSEDDGHRHKRRHRERDDDRR